jgi:hypothetical protein
MNALDEYAMKFKENFPVYGANLPEGKSLEGMARECIEKGKPYRPKKNKEKGIVY